MKKGAIYIFLHFVVFAAIAISFPEQIKPDDVMTEVEKHFNQGRVGVNFKSEIAADTPFSKMGNDFFNENFLYIDYLTKHSPEYMDSIAGLFTLYLIAHDQNVQGYIEKPKRRYTLHELKATAVRFILPIKVSPDGKIGTQICVSGEGFKDYPDRDINFEAFIFDAIFNEIKNKDGFLIGRITEYSKFAGALKLSTNQEALLKRAQGLMWALFYKDLDFEKALLERYQSKAEYLSFEVTLE